MNRFFVILFPVILLIGCGPNINTPTASASSGKKVKIISLPGFTQGDKLNVDGPLWYDGAALIETYNLTHLKLSINMNVPSVGGVPYKIKDGKISITIKMDTDTKAKKDNLTIVDNNAVKNFNYGAVKTYYGKTEAGWFSQPKSFLTLSTRNQSFTFTFQEPGKVEVKSKDIPGSLTLTKMT